MRSWRMRNWVIDGGARSGRFQGDVDHFVDDRDRIGQQVILCGIVKYFPGGQFKAATVQRTFYLRARQIAIAQAGILMCCLLYTSPSPRDGLLSRMPSSA